MFIKSNVKSYSLFTQHFITEEDVEGEEGYSEVGISASVSSFMVLYVHRNRMAY